MAALNDSELEHIESFIGYGNLKAPVWWLGMEEGMAKNDDPESNLRARLQNREVEDLYHVLKRDGVTKYHEGNRVAQPTWWPMCEVMLSIANKQTGIDSKRAYQAEQLGRHNDETLLVELMPIPKPALSSWGYEHLIPQYQSRDHYYRSVMPRRITMIGNLIEKHRPGLVVAYGKAYWDHYRRLFRDMEFKPHPLSAEFQYGRGRVSGLLIPHTTSRNMNGLVELLGRVARGMLAN